MQVMIAQSTSAAFTSSPPLGGKSNAAPKSSTAAFPTFGDNGFGHQAACGNYGVVD